MADAAPRVRSAGYDFEHGAPAPPPAPPTLEAHNINQTFERDSANEVKALIDVSLTLMPGDFVTVVGMNGSGKSTLLNVVAGALTPDSGSIKLDGTDVTKQDEHRRARHVGRVFQDPLRGTAPNLTIAENLSLALDRELPLRRALEFWGGNVSDAMDALDLTRLAQVPVRLLSTGQAKRATLARVAASSAPLWLLDEPLNGLDSDGVARLDALVAAHLARGGAVLAASHGPLGGSWAHLELGV